MHNLSEASKLPWKALALWAPLLTLPHRFPILLIIRDRLADQTAQWSYPLQPPWCAAGLIGLASLQDTLATEHWKLQKFWQTRMRQPHNTSTQHVFSNVGLWGMTSHTSKKTGLKDTFTKSIFSAELWLIINKSLKCVQSIKIGPCPRALSTLKALRFLWAAFVSTRLLTSCLPMPVNPSLTLMFCLRNDTHRVYIGNALCHALHMH